MDGAIERYEADFCPRVSRKPEGQRHTQLLLGSSCGKSQRSIPTGVCANLLTSIFDLFHVAGPIQA